MVNREKVKLFRGQEDTENVKQGSKLGGFGCKWEKHVRNFSETKTK